MKSIFDESLGLRMIHYWSIFCQASLSNLSKVNLTIAGVRKRGNKDEVLVYSSLMFFGLSTLNIQDKTEGDERQ